MHGTNTSNAWNFASAFAALDVSPTKLKAGTTENQKIVDISEEDHKQTQDFDDDATPTVSTDQSSNLGDLRQALAYLGYSVAVLAPESNLNQSDSGLEEKRDTLPPNITPTKQGPTKAITFIPENNGVDTNPQNHRESVKRAELGRRRVLDTFLGSSPENVPIIDSKQYSSKLKKSNGWIKNGLSPSSVVPQVEIRSRKKVSAKLAAEKKVQLVLELHKRFPKDNLSFSNLTFQETDKDNKGIHCFVDISNVC